LPRSTTSWLGLLDVGALAMILTQPY
jgi:hypothetical protein